MRRPASQKSGSRLRVSTAIKLLMVVATVFSLVNTAEPILAIRNNRQGISQSVLEKISEQSPTMWYNNFNDNPKEYPSLPNTGGYRISTGGGGLGSGSGGPQQCGDIEGVHGGSTFWLSQDNRSSDVLIDLPETGNAINIQVNYIGYTCDSGYLSSPLQSAANSIGALMDPSRLGPYDRIRESRFTNKSHTPDIKTIEVSAVDNNDNPIPGVGTSTTGLSPVTLDFESVHHRDRFTKDGIGPGRDNQNIPYQDITVTGVNNIREILAGNPGSQVTLKLSIAQRIVHSFLRSNGTLLYLCQEREPNVNGVMGPPRALDLDGDYTYRPYGAANPALTHEPCKSFRSRLTINIRMAAPAITCTPSYQRVTLGETVNFSASGGSPYAWTAHEGTPLSGSGETFSTSFSTVGPKMVTVQRGAASANCQVDVSEKPNLPYLGIEGGDVLSGASFGSEVSSENCVATPAAANAAIKTNGYFSKSDTGAATDLQRGGSSAAQYAVFASGGIGDTSGTNSSNTFLGNYGYLRDGIERQKDMLFANFRYPPPDSEYGRFYGGEQSGLPCVKPGEASPAATVFDATDFVKNHIGTKKLSGPVIINTTSVNPGTKKTLIVDGSVTIKGPITYQNSSSYGLVGNIPYLKIIATNIYIERNAHTIDGHLVAYPPDQTTGGIIDTCSDMYWQFDSGPALQNPGGWPTAAGGKMVINSCDTGSVASGRPGLIVNGSITARRILWKRSYGTIGYKPEVTDPACYYANYGTSDDAGTPGVIITSPDTAARRLKLCAAEYIDFNPEAYLARFGDGTANVNPVPVSSVEVPPVY